jgi:hypothetical protein
MSDPEIVEKPIIGDHHGGMRWIRQQNARLLWLSFGTGVVSGFLFGVVAGGLESRLIEGVMGGIAFLIAGVYSLAEAKLVAAISRVALFLASVAGGLGIGYGGRASTNLRGAEQLASWLGAVETKVGLAVVGLAIIIASVLSFLGNRTVIGQKRQ